MLVRRMQRNLVRLVGCTLTVALAFFVGSPAHAVVKFFDGFGDADRDNNGTPLEPFDVDVDRDEEIGEYTPGRLGMGGATNTEISTVLDANDVGLRWLAIRGYTGSNEGDPKPTLRIVDDTQGMMQETMPVMDGGLGITAIDDGYALSFNSKGRGSEAVAFFDETISLGTNEGDQVKVSFDFRIWRDADNANAVPQPDDGELRFGLFQDTDNQLGMTNPFAGRAVDTNGDGFLDDQPAVWGEEEGLFDGLLTGTKGSGDDVGASGDYGWYGAVIIENPDGQFPPLVPNGGGWRIREETNEFETSNTDLRILQGASDTVAVPDESTPGAGDFGLVNLNVNKVYNLSLTLERATDTTPGDTIQATLTAIDRETGEEFSLVDQEPLENSMGEPDGISSDSWDYFVIRNTGFDDFDYIIDNFMIELISTAGLDGDFNENGIVDAADYTVWRDNLGSDTPLPNGTGGTVGPADYDLWKQNFGNVLGASSAVNVSGAVPEPGTLALLTFSFVSMFAATWRRGM